MTTRNIYIGIDPDLRALNCAVLLAEPSAHAHKPPATSLLAVFLRRNKTPHTKDKAVAEAVRCAVSLADDVVNYFIKNPQYQQCSITLIVESQSMQHQRKSKHKIDPDNILQLGQIAGVLMGAFSGISDNIHLVQPALWKGQIKKHIHHPRIMKHLNLPYKSLTTTIYPDNYTELSHHSGDRINPGDFEDINDSMGLALYGAL